MSIGGLVALSVVAAGLAGVSTMFTEPQHPGRSTARERAAAPTVDAAPVDTSPAEALPPRVPPTADSGLGTLTGPQGAGPDHIGTATQRAAPAPTATTPRSNSTSKALTGPPRHSPTSPAKTSPAAAGGQGEPDDKVLAADTIDKDLIDPPAGTADEAPAREPVDASRVSDPASHPVVRHPRKKAKVKAPAAPAVTRQTVSETEPVAFTTRQVRDWSLPPGTRQIQTPGVAGERTVRFRITLKGGKETDRRLLDVTVTREPQEQVIAFGPGRANDDVDQNLDGNGEGEPGFDEPPDCSWDDEEPWDAGFGFCG